MIHTIKWAWQRVVRGYDDRLLWGLNEYLDPMVVAHVKNLRENGHGHPSEMTEKKWNKILDTILAGFVPEPETLAGSKTWGRYLRNRKRALVCLAFYWDNLWD